METIGTMPTAAFAAVTPFEMIGCCEYHESLLIEVKVFLGEATAGDIWRRFFTNRVQFCVEVRVLVPLHHNPSVHSLVQTGRS